MMTTDEQLTPVAREIVSNRRKQNRIEGRSRTLTWTIVAALVAVVVGVVYLLAHAQTTDEVTSQLAAQGRVRDAQITGIQDQLKSVCRKVANPASLTPQEREGCYRAENSIPPPAPPAVTITQAPPAGSGPTVAQIQSMIDSALAQVPRPLTVEQVAATAQQVFALYAPGIAATPEKLADAVSGFCASDRCRGPQGAKGDPAPPVTDAQLRAQVDAYCAANNGCVGPAGAQGLQGFQGISVQDFGDPEVNPADPSKCRIPVVLVDPGQNARTFKDYFNVPAAFCLPS